MEKPSVENHPSPVIKIAEHILGAATRFLAAQRESNEESTLTLASPHIVEALTLDGPSRTLEEFYITDHTEPGNPLSKPSQLKIRCQNFIQTAREQIFLPKQVKALMLPN
jgi:hypothetical protein